MNLQNFLENLIAGILCTAICALVKRFYRYVKTTEEDIEPSLKPSPSKTLHKQFFTALFTLVISLPAAFMFPIERRPTIPGAFRVFLFIVAGFAFLLVWGAFDAAFAFYPRDDSRKNIPTESATNSGSKER